MTMLAEYGTLSLARCSAPAIQLADGYPIEAQTANSIERQKSWIKQWKYSPAVFLPHAGEAREAPEAGEMFRQPDLAATLRKLVDAEAQALKARQVAEARRSTPPTIASTRATSRRRSCAACASRAACSRPRTSRTGRSRSRSRSRTTYKGIEVYKLREWQQGPVMLQALNILEKMDVKAMGYNTPKYMHTIYQAMNLAFADRDFYYGDPAFPARGADSRAAVEGVREARGRRRSTGERTIRT